MTLQSYGAASTGVRQHAASQTQAQVCMHVMGSARTDERVLRAARALAQTGMRVLVVDVERDTARPQDEVLDTIWVRHIFMPSWFVPTRFKPWFVVKAIRMLVKRVCALLSLPFDAYHAHDHTALLASYIAARVRRKPVIFDAHEVPLFEASQQSALRLHLLRALSAWLLRWMLPRCAGVITVSPPIVTELQRRYGGPPPTLVRNIPPYQPPMPNTQRFHQRLGLPPHTRIALYQGVLHEERALDLLVRAARYLAPDIALVLLGDGSSKSQLETLIAQEQVQDRVYLLPAVPYQELLRWTASADLGLIIYRVISANAQFCLPNKLFEYLMAGLPVLASPLEAIAELLERYDVGQVVERLTPEAIAQAINHLLADPEALARMRANALAASQQELCWEIEQERLLTLYRSVLGMRLEEGA